MDDDAMNAAIRVSCDDGSLEEIIKAYLLALPKPATPFEQAIAYRKLVGME